MKYIQTVDVLSSKIDDDIVLFDEAGGAYFTMNGVGTKIWEMLQSPIAVDEIVVELQRIYEVDEETSRQDLVPFIQDLVSRKLVQTIA